MHTQKPMAELQKLPLFMDVDVLGSYERMIFEVFYVGVPATAKNFHALCAGNAGLLWYVGCYFHQVRRESSYVMGGAISEDTEEYMGSIYGQNFPDESNDMKHDKEGLLSMSKRDQKAGSSKFLITLRVDQSLDSSHVVFGKLVGGLTTLRRIGKICFKWPVKIVDCGVVQCDWIPHYVTLLADEDSDPMTPERVDDDWPAFPGEGELGESYPVRVEDLVISGTSQPAAASHYTTAGAKRRSSSSSDELRAQMREEMQEEWKQMVQDMHTMKAMLRQQMEWNEAMRRAMVNLGVQNIRLPPMPGFHIPMPISHEHQSPAQRARVARGHVGADQR